MGYSPVCFGGRHSDSDGDRFYNGKTGRRRISSNVQYRHITVYRQQADGSSAESSGFSFGGGRVEKFGALATFLLTLAISADGPRSSGVHERIAPLHSRLVAPCCGFTSDCCSLTILLD